MATTSLDNVKSILDLFNPQKTTEVSSSQSNISAEGVQAALKQILESNSGLAAVSSGQKSAGLYNSSTNQLLTNDLVARAAGQVAQLQAGTTTSKTTGKSTQLPFGSTLVAALANSVLGPSVKKGIKSSGLDTVGDKISNAIFGGDAGGVSPGSFASSSTGMVDPTADAIGAGLGDAASNLFSSGSGDVTSTSSDSLLSNLFTNSDAPVDNTGDIVSSFGDAASSDAGSSVADSISSLFGFADGGLVGGGVPSKNMLTKTSPISSIPTKNPAKGVNKNPVGYADGGKVQGPSAGSSTDARYITSTGKVIGGNQNDVSGDGGELGAPGLAQPEGTTNHGPGWGNAASIAANIAIGNPVGAVIGVANAISNNATGKSIIGNAISDISDFFSSTPAPNDPSFDTLGVGLMEGDTTGGIDIGAPDPSASGGYGSEGFGGFDPGSSDTGSSESASEGFGGESSGESESGGYKSGGKVPGHDSKGTDSVPAKLTKGEYVIPVDVVDHLGAGYFDKLVAKYHTPVGAH